jgi:hypothetical protein
MPVSIKQTTSAQKKKHFQRRFQYIGMAGTRGEGRGGGGGGGGGEAIWKQIFGGKWSCDRHLHYSEHMENISLCIFSVSHALSTI